VRLGQPVPTLSGGEAQRLKIAGFLAQAEPAPAHLAQLARNGSLMLFDEPTTGLHFDDISRLMRALRRLIDCGHSLILIEHNLDVIRAADWIIDLGPEGGEGGGTIVAQGDPRSIAAHPTSHTGKALREYEATLTSDATTLTPGPSSGLRPEEAGGRERGGSAAPSCSPSQDKRLIASGVSSSSPLPLAGQGPGVRVFAAQEEPVTTANGWIEIRNAREHNLKGIDVEIPRDTFTVITRRLGQRQVDAGLRYPVQRGPAALPGIAERVRPVRSCSRPGGPTWMRSTALRHGRDRAARQPRRPQEHGSHADRGAHIFCGCCS